MNRRGFISMLAGAAGAPLVPWRGLIEPRIFLPSAAGTIVTVEMLQRARAILLRYADIETNPPVLWDASTGRFEAFRSVYGPEVFQVYESSWPR